MPDEPIDDPEFDAAAIARRVISERERLGLTTAQFAVLAGISEAQQSAIEGGDVSAAPFSWGFGEYGFAARRAGADPMFILGYNAQPDPIQPQPEGEDQAFQAAIRLLRKSQRAVEAFVGEGASQSCPQLVAALMSATLHGNYPTAGEWEEFGNNLGEVIAGALYELGGRIAGDPEEY